MFPLATCNFVGRGIPFDASCLYCESKSQNIVLDGVDFSFFSLKVLLSIN